MTPAAHSTQRRYPGPAMRQIQERPPRDHERRVQLFRHLGFVIAHIADTVPLHNLPAAATKAVKVEAWRSYFRTRFNDGNSFSTLDDEPLRMVIYDIESTACTEMNVVFPEQPQRTTT